jgi:holliday junction DNA helicase RuvA
VISFLRGRLLRKGDDRIVLFCGEVGYDILVIPICRRALLGIKAGPEGEEISLHISYFHSAHQTRPLLIGFENELERDFFEKLVSVEDMGPTAAARALTKPVPLIACAIEERNARFLTGLDGIGPRKAEKIIASLHGKVGKFALMSEAELPAAETRPADKDAIQQEVLSALVEQLGYRPPEAKKAVEAALKRNPALATAEDIFEEIFRGMKTPD